MRFEVRSSSSSTPPHPSRIILSRLVSASSEGHCYSTISTHAFAVQHTASAFATVRITANIALPSLSIKSTSYSKGEGESTRTWQQRQQHNGSTIDNGRYCATVSKGSKSMIPSRQEDKDCSYDRNLCRGVTLGSWIDRLCLHGLDTMQRLDLEDRRTRRRSSVSSPVKVNHTRAFSATADTSSFDPTRDHHILAAGWFQSRLCDFL